MAQAIIRFSSSLHVSLGDMKWHWQEVADLASRLCSRRGRCLHSDRRWPPGTCGGAFPAVRPGPGVCRAPLAAALPRSVAPAVCGLPMSRAAIFSRPSPAAARPWISWENTALMPGLGHGYSAMLTHDGLSAVDFLVLMPRLWRTG